MKKLLCSLLAASMLATSLCGASLAEESNLIAQAQSDSNFNATGYPIVNEPVKKTIMIRKPANIGDPSEMATLNYIAKLMNVEIEWIVVGADGWAERINLMFASRDLPDIIMKGEMSKMVSLSLSMTSSIPIRPVSSHCWNSIPALTLPPVQLTENFMPCQASTH